MIISGLTWMKYLSYGADLIPCAFLLFGCIKEKLKDTAFHNEEELSVTVRGNYNIDSRRSFAECFFSIGEVTKWPH
jgi:hypothetical protein